MTTSKQPGPVPPHIVDRPRLTSLLDDTAARVILLVGPAGYGKTTLARQWFSKNSAHAVWYRARHSSADVAALAVELARSASTSFGFTCQRIDQRLRSSSDPNGEAATLGTVLADDLQAWPSDCWLVLDDYQAIASSDVAEELVQALIDHTSFPVLLTARQRPRWVSTRDILYGNVCELGKSALAMTHGEAAAALKASSSSDQLTGLMALAEGWPAVIGLAALTSASLEISEDQVPEALHDFLAEELYRELEGDLRRELGVIAFASAINSQLMSALFGERAETILREAERRGFLLSQETQYELHPLLRHFLQLKVTEFDPPLSLDIVEEICRWEVAQRNWDDAILLADRFEMTALVFEIIETSLDLALSQGRVASIENWLLTARKHDPASPTVSLGEMEICFRRHQWDEARSHALQLSSKLAPDDPRLSRALHRIGQIGHLDDRYDEAVFYLRSARAAAQTDRDLRAALSSQFLAASDLGDRDEARRILEELKVVPNANADDLLRLSQAELHLAARWGGVESELKRQSGSLALIDHSTDPVGRSGFLQTYGAALILTARYEEAIEIADRQITEAHDLGLEWVIPHALELRGSAQWGLRDFDAAASTLRDAYRLSRTQSDLHGRLNAAVLLARVHLAQGSPDRALEATELDFDRPPGPSMLGDLLAVRALAQALTGHPDEALDLVVESERYTEHIEVRVVRSFVKAILTMQDGSVERDLLEVDAVANAFTDAHETENYDAFVLAYRAFPPLLTSLASRHDPSAKACRLHIPTADRRMAERAGLAPKRPHEGSPDPLTRREQEVLSLIRNGLTNREIAATLWIAESTVKVHVGNVLRKLGARSRTEALSLTSRD